VVLSSAGRNRNTLKRRQSFSRKILSAFTLLMLTDQPYTTSDRRKKSL
jgi:hypothetical protein